jgi:hypothetical protein
LYGLNLYFSQGLLGEQLTSFAFMVCGIAYTSHIARTGLDRPADFGAAGAQDTQPFADLTRRAIDLGRAD